ncbi:L6202.3-like protein [Leishmania tarentolae]|uniref:L6202.3-like protein n=1 Tax=Leishmania tarentolae TaxID=5689 RepID=A0A640L1L4_LEITA|nr:L6202.3-like protein [Leishmania tarentolae]
MSVPVAGRRKGLSSGSSPTSSFPLPASQKVESPSWLDDLDGSTIPPAAPVVVHASPGSQELPYASITSRSPVDTVTPTVREPPAGESDPLDFLNEVEAPPSAPADVGWRTNLAVSGEGTVSSVSPSSPAVPAFLREDGDDAPEASAMIWMTGSAPSHHQATSISAAAAAAQHAEEERQEVEKIALTQQLSELERQLDEASKRVDALQKESHPLAIEVSKAECMLDSLRTKEAAARQKKEEEAESRQRAREQTFLTVDSGDVEEELREYREQCVQRLQQQVEDLMQAVEKQQSVNASLRAEWEGAIARETQDDNEASVFEALLLRVQEGARHLKRRLALQCRGAVAESARTYLAAARQQRADVFANDTAARVRTLQLHHTRCKEEAAAFHDTCRRTFQERADSAFGAAKVDVEAARRYHENESRQRVVAFQCQLASMTERSREMLEQQVHRLLEQECTIATTQQDGAAKELKARQQDMSAQLQAFHSRANTEVRLLRERGWAHRTSGESASQTPMPPVPAHEVLRGELERVRARMGQVALSLRIKHDQQLSTSYVQGTSGAVDYEGTTRACGAVNSPASSPFLVEQLNEKWQCSLLSLQQSRETLRSTISDVQQASRGYAVQLQQHRTQVTQQQEVVKAVRAEWEQAIRGQLSRCLTAASSQVPAPVTLTTGALDNLSRRIAAILRAQQSLRTARTSFTANLSTWSKSLTDHRMDTERLLGNIFQQLDLLREGSVQLEVDQLTLQSLQAQVDVLEQHVEEGAKRLAHRKRCVEAFMKDLHAGLHQSHTLPSPLAPQVFPAMRKGDSTHMTRVFGDGNHISAICDTPTRGGADAAGLDADPHEKRAAKKAAPPKRAMKQTSSPSAQIKASSVTPRSLVARTTRVTALAGKDPSQEGPRTPTGGVVVRTGPTKSDADVLCSYSPSPILPTLKGTCSGGSAEESASPLYCAPAYVSSAVHGTSAAVDAEADKGEKNEGDCSSNLVPPEGVYSNDLDTLSTCTG